MKTASGYELKVMISEVKTILKYVDICLESGKDSYDPLTDQTVRVTKFDQVDQQMVKETLEKLEEY